MGTRSLTCVYVNGEYKVAQYCQWDGYPSGVGVDILKFISKQENVDALRKTIANVSFATIGDIEFVYRWFGVVKEYISMDESTLMSKRFPEFHRNTGPKILDLIIMNDGIIKLKNDIEFAAESLFCEWCYVIDLDKNTFEVYRGFNKTRLDINERFYFLDDQEETVEYKPVYNLKNYSLDNLPDVDTFIAEQE